MAPHPERVTVTEHHDVYPGIDLKTRLKDAAKGKIIYITGASRGIGEATVHAFAEAGASGLFVTARSADALTAVAESARRIAPSIVVEACTVDATDEQAVSQSVRKCIEKFGRIDVVIANAGYLEKRARTGEIDPREWWKTMDISLRGTFNVIHHSINHLVATKGYAIMLSSVAAQHRSRGASAYQTSKHAINRLAEFVDVEYGSQGVKVFAVHPGNIATALASNEPAIAAYLIDKIEIASHTMVRLTSGSENWLSGRYISCNWDLDELAKRRKEIEGGDLLKNRLDIGSLAGPL
ncbi:oxidoreductase [Gloeophyllum trabeum ATCC 11539]|uniref:Oxidoreductase n=1 Tax=Gloeophyllum trabeum (strain ATCC 11539 / FP-39264 / Madison 617) TaxID=670483 RepID=S7QDV5_GLOTA|nr:oxidoreductase [Gloeophyllum trabeum ATCC 11539]EPQ57587.1 oxidoreductase [Gloeophyllum trabeum ATCC 11539]